MSEEPNARGNWWATLPGVLTALAGFITAIAGLIVALHQLGFAVNSPATTAPTEKRQGSPGGRESTIQVGTGEIVYKVLGTRIDRQAEGRRTLRVRVDMTCHQTSPCYFGGSDFRLLVNGAQRAPLSGPNEPVPSNSTKQAIAVFEIPEAAERAEFMVVGHGDPYKVPIDLKR